MAVEWEYSVSFRVHHPSADPAAIAEALEWSPQWAWKAGQPRRDGAKKPLPGKYSKSYCSFDLTTSRKLPLGKLLRRALNRLQDKRIFLRDLVDSGGRLEFLVAIYVTKATGDELDSTILAKCGELGVGLALLVSPFAMPHYEDTQANNLSLGIRRAPVRGRRKGK
jgi:hypothetical protein